MSTDIATLGIKVDSSDVRNASGELKILVEVGTKAEKATDGLKDSFGGLKAALAGLGLGALAKEAIDLADTYSNIQGRLSLVTSGSAELASVTDKLFDSAQRARVGFEATTDLYSSLARSTKSLGTSQTDLLQVTETINKALIVSGASAATAEGALTQLGQGFASGTLRGDELNAVLEGTPRLAQAIADGMGVTVGQLRALGAEGKITGETVFNALKSQKDAIETEFAKMPTTVAQSFVQLRNEILKYVGETNSASGVTTVLAGGVSLLAKNLDIVVPIVATLAIGLGVGFVTSAVAARIAAVETGGALVAMGAAARGAGSALLGAFGGPIGLAITAVTVGIGAFAAESARAGNIVDTVNRSYDEMQKRLNAAKLAADSAAGGSSGVGSAAKGAVPGVDSLTGAVKALADNLYRQADAAKKARIEMAANALAEARKNEMAASELVGNVRGTRANEFRRGDFLNNAGVIGGAIVAKGRSILSGGRTDKEAEDAYARSVRVSLQAKKELDAAYQSSNSAISGTSNINAAEIKKLQEQVKDLRQIRGSLSGKELKRVDSKIAAGERKIQLLGSGAAEDAVNAAVGSGGGGGRSGGKSDAQREYEQSVEASKRYVEQLQNETAAIGKTAIEQRLLDAEREAAKAPTEALRQQILAEANAWANATLAQEINESVRKTLTEAIEREARASQDAQNAGKQLTDQIEFEAGLQRMSAEQRAVAIATRDMETKGIKEGTVAWMLYSDAILGAARTKGALEGRADEAAAVADHMRAVNDNVRAATDSFGQLFGTAGEGFASLIQVVSDYAEASAEAEARIADARARYGADSVQAKQAEADAAEQAASREMAAYGQVIHGVKGLFKEKSTAYKVMEGVEKAYAAVRLALAVKDIFFETARTTAVVAGSGARIAADTAETGTSVLNSGVRAAAHGVEAIARAIASLPFPLNIAAGVATAAALIGFGVKVFGGGGGGGGASAQAEKEPAKPYDYANTDSPYSVMQTQPGYGAGSRNVGYANDNRSSQPAANNNGMTISFGAVTVNADGANSETVNQLRTVLQEHQEETVEKARKAVQNDRVNGYGRQQIGGVN
ncbi:Caudovirus, tape measure, N-terminal [uncultured Caudovirales phage]|uniref:Caudovirus, tape measure, N-terminal n=1 Tax=uncultured Caudovirales phage TaxID=2100421 RepID=A0A6J5LBD5_9CAUD|nr:Caudovirus, tape measure, N-terminal [uncultured Caudovirales phage]